jgi:NTP pyrophosphatase (non-canonical NTP hydrolase)
MKELIKKIQEWGREKGINDPYKQAIKTMEELGELSGSLLKGKRDEEIDAVGDIVVCLAIYCDIQRIDIEQATELAYDTIKGRTGKNVDGVFVKDENPYKEKTAAWWFWQSDWREDVKQKAIKNTEHGASVHDSLKDALEGSFTWIESPEGEDFWGEIYDSLLDKNN